MTMKEKRAYVDQACSDVVFLHDLVEDRKLLPETQKILIKRILDLVCEIRAYSIDLIEEKS